MAERTSELLVRFLCAGIPSNVGEELGTSASEAW